MVEVGSLLTAVPGLGDLTNDDALKQTYFYAARDPLACVLRSSAHCFPLPRLAPRPFSKEQSLHRRDSGPPRPGPAGVPKAALRGLDSRMPSLAGQEAGGGEAAQAGSPSPHKASGLRQAVSAFESHSAGPVVGTGTGERCPAASAGVPHNPPCSSRPQLAAKPALPTRKLPGTLPRPAPLSPDARSAAPLQEEEAAAQARRLPKAGSVEDQAGHLPGPPLRPKRRPVSAIFTEGLLPPGPGLGGKPPPAPPEKTWIRKPRPLSVDLTARFESREVLLRRAAIEGAGPECWGAGGAGPEPAADRAGPAQAATSPLHLDAEFREVAKKIQDRKEKMLLKREEGGSPRSPGVSARAILGGDQSPEEEKDRLDLEPKKVPESPSSWPGRGLGPAEAKSGRADLEASPGAEWMSVGSVKKRLSLFEEQRALVPAVGSESTMATSETPLVAPQFEQAGVSVQTRIKGWAAESTEEKVEIRQRALQTRPRSADLTKVFSSSAPSSEMRYEKCAVPVGQLPGEQREKQKQGCNVDGVPTPRSPWKLGGPQKASRHTERQASSSQDTDSPGQAPRASPEGERGFQTVWATMFEHHVERHSVAEQGAHHSAPDPRSGADACSPEPRTRPKRCSWLGKDLLVGQAALSDCVSGQCPVPVLEKPAPGDGHSQAALPKHWASLPWTQRVEPRVDIMHAVGDKAHSEAVTTAVEDRAVTLRGARSRRSLRGQWLTQEATPADPEGGPEAPVGAVHRASLIWEARGQENGGPENSLGSNCTSPRWAGGAVAHWHNATVAGSQEPCAPRDIATKVVQAAPWEAPRQGPNRAGHKPAGGISPADRAPVQGAPPEPPSWGKDPQAHGHPEAEKPLPAAVEGDPPSARRAEAGVRLRKAHPGDPRADKWRRRTLPHDTKFDVFRFLPPENPYKGEQRHTGPLSAPAGASPKPPETRRVTAGDLQAPALPGPQGSPMEPQATFFAVTYQIPDIQKVKSMMKSGLENLLEHSRKKALAASPHACASALVPPDQEEPSGPSGSKPRARGSRGDPPVTAPRSPKAAECSWPVGDGVRGRPSERPLPMGALWIPPGSQDGSASQNAKKDSWSKVTPNTPSAPQATLAPRSRPKAHGQPGRRKTEIISETFPGKMKDSYRSSVLDLDALMAEYKAKSTGAALPGPTAEASALPGERPAQPSTVAPEAQGPWERAGVAATAGSPSLGPSNPQSRDPGIPTAPKPSSPLWGLPQSAPAPAGSSPQTKALALTEEGQATVGAKPSGHEDLGSGVCLSPKSPPAEPKTGTPRTPTSRGWGDSRAPWGDALGDSRRPLDVKRCSSEKGRPASVCTGLAAMREAMQRRQEQPRAGAQAAVEACRGEPRAPPDSPPVSPRDADASGGPWGSEQSLRTLSPRAAGPRRSQSLCKEQRAGPCMGQLKQCFSQRSPEAKDTDTLVQDTGSRDSTWAEPRSSGDSLAPESPSPDGSATTGRRQLSSSRFSSSSSPSSPPGPTEEHGHPRGPQSTEPEATDSPGGALQPDARPACPVDHFPFIRQTSVLDSSALKTRAQLSKRSRRRAPTLSHALRSRSSEVGGQAPLEEEADSAWMFKDSTEEKSPQREESDEEESPSRAERTPAGHLHRTPAFPGMSPAALKARLHKRPEVDSPSEMPCWAPRTPKSPFQPGVLGSRVLPSSMDKDDRSEESSPQWLRELKSKKRQSLCENQA